MGNIKASFNRGTNIMAEMSRNTTGYVYIYGAEIEVTYTVPEPATDTLHVKQNGTWKKVAKAYKKTNGTWTEIDPADAFQSGVKLVLGQ